MRLGDFPEMFSLARGIRRHLVFRLGPTNSGKTHEALEALMEARSGVYLAPLRLLAMEVRDRLMNAGIPCNLVTGEERVMVPGAQHTACTVEMMDPTMEVRVAVLDENSNAARRTARLGLDGSSGRCSGPYPVCLW